MLNKKRVSKNRLLLLGTFIFLIVLSIPTFLAIIPFGNDSRGLKSAISDNFFIVHSDFIPYPPVSCKSKYM